MQKLHSLARKAAAAVWRTVRAVLTPLRWLAHTLLGQWRWQAPTWLHHLGQGLSPWRQWAHAQAAWVALLLALLGAGTWVACHGPQGGWRNSWLWQTFNGAQADAADMREASAELSFKRRFSEDGASKPSLLVVKFSVPAAPLARVDKEATDVSLSPPLAGKWTWASASRLEFLPEQDWPIDTPYQIKLGSKALAAHVSAKRTLDLRSPAFSVEVKNAVFYQDPVQVSLRKAVFEVGFSHPVKPETFEQHLQFEVQGVLSGLLPATADQAPFTVVYDKWRMSATVHSQPLPIPQSASTMQLRIAPGVAAQQGGKPTVQALVHALTIPGLYSLDITDLKQAIVTADTGEPKHVLQLTAGMPVHEKEMSRSLSVWLLPEKNPQYNAEDGGEVWHDPQDVTDTVFKQSKKIALSAVPSERDIQETHGFEFSAEPGRYLLVRVQKGLKSAGGFQLGQSRDEIIRVKRSAPELAILSKGALLALSGEKKLPLIVRDLPGVKMEIGRLLPMQLQHLITQSQGDMSKPEFYAGITPDHLTERFEKQFTYALKPGKTHYETIDFSDYLKVDASDRRGIFLLTVQGFDPADKASEPDLSRTARQGGAQDAYDPESEGEDSEEASDASAEPESVSPSQLRDRRLVIVTDLALVSKLAADGSRDVFVQSIATGQAVAGASVEIWARNGSVVLSQLSDATGRARLPSTAGLLREKAPVALVVRKGQDVSFLPLNRADRNMDVSRFDVGGLRTASLPNQIQAYVFSDRGIYRPGDTMHIGIVAKSTNWAQKLANLPVEVELLDARGLTVRRETIRLGRGGMVDVSHTTSDTSPTGSYTVNVNLPRDTAASSPGAAELPAQRLGSVTVKVQEFMPDRMKVSARLSAPAAAGWIAPKDLKTMVNVQNLFGTPAPNRGVEAVLTLEPAYPSFKGFADYSFYDPSRAKDSVRADLQKGLTNEQGNTEFALGLQRYAQATYQLHVLVRAFEPEGGRSVAAEASALVSDRPYLIGHKADGDLDFIARNSVRKVQFIALNPTLQKRAAEGLRLLRVERKVVSVLVKQANGLLKYESRNKESVLKEEAYAVSAQGNTVSLATQTPGNFAYVLRDAQDLELARVNYSVAGAGNVSRSLDRNAELQMTLDKKDYEPGEEIALSIRAPYAGAGLITIERDKVYAYKWFTAQDTASVQKISLPKDFEGNGYVSVQFARDLASNEVYMSPMSYGVQPFATSLAKRSNPMTLQVPELVKPGQTVKFKLDTQAPSRAVVFAVDEGILQVARYQTPNPLKFFFQKRALEVSTQQTLDLVLPEFKKLMQAAPGGDAEGEAGKHLNPFKRRTDAPVVFWSGVVDVQGSREFSYTVPDYFNGSLRVMAIAINDDTASALAKSTVVRGDLVLLPNAPVAMSPGDEVQVSVNVANQLKGSGRDAALNVTLTPSAGLELVGSAAQQLKVAEGSEGLAKFRLRAKSGAQAQLGAANLVFSAQIGETKARLSTTLSVRPASSWVSAVQTGLLRGQAKLTSGLDLYPEWQRSELSVSASPLAFSVALSHVLQAGTHASSEQLSSRIVPMVLQTATATAAAKAPKAGPSEPPGPEAKKLFERYVQQLRARQTAEGGLAMWPGASADVSASVYAVELLAEAKARQWPVPNDVLQRLNLYVQARLGESANRSESVWRMHTQAAYVLTRQGMVTTAVLSNLHEDWRQRIARASTDKQREALRRDAGMAYLAASFKLLKQDKLAQELWQAPWQALLESAQAEQASGAATDAEPWLYRANVLQLMARHFPAQIKTLPIDFWLRLANSLADRPSDLLAARVVWAIEAYAAQVSQSGVGKISAAARNRAGLTQALAVSAVLPWQSLPVMPDATELTLGNGAELPVFYAWSQSGFERSVPKEALSQGLEVSHDFLNAQGKVVSESAVGEELTLRLRLRATQRNSVPAVALVSLLPAGFEPVLSAGSEDAPANAPLWRRRLGLGGGWPLDYVDIREDRLVFHGTATNTLVEVSVKVRASHVGEFQVPAAFAQATYEPRLLARAAGAKFVVKPAAP